MDSARWGVEALLYERPNEGGLPQKEKANRGRGSTGSAHEGETGGLAEG